MEQKAVNTVLYNISSIEEVQKQIEKQSELKQKIIWVKSLV